MTTKQILAKLEKLNQNNKRLYERKTALEKDILKLDIEIYGITWKYSDLVKSLLKDDD